MTEQAQPKGARWIACGVVLGLLTGGLLVGSWYRSAAGLSVTVLGAGRQSSVLITSNHRRVLIAAGTNGSAFSNALGDALPPVDNTLDLVLIDPMASQDAQDRVRALDAHLVWMLPSSGEATGSDTVEQSFAVEFDASIRLDVRIDLVGTWHAELTSRAGRILIASDPAAVQVQPGAAVVISTHEYESGNFGAPLAVIVPGAATPASQQVLVVSPGSTIKLSMTGDEIRTDAAVDQ